jgi:replicative DNA helicase
MDKQPQSSNPQVPTAIETERTILAKALTNKEQALELLSGTDESYFWSLKNQSIYLAIRDIVAEGGTPDYITVSNHLKGSDGVKASDIAALIEAQFDSHASIPQLVAILEQAATQRQTLRLILDAQQDIAASRQDVLPNLVSELLKLNSRSVRKTTFTAKELVAEFYETLGERQRNGGIAGIPFGYRDLDTYTSGMKPGQLIFIAARTSQGKSAFS